jgi:hypothetical protein
MNVPGRAIISRNIIRILVGAAASRRSELVVRERSDALRLDGRRTPRLPSARIARMPPCACRSFGRIIRCTPRYRKNPPVAVPIKTLRRYAGYTVVKGSTGLGACAMREACCDPNLKRVPLTTPLRRAETCPYSSEAKQRISICMI